jgi:sec-independent protein translocase protein TatA
MRFLTNVLKAAERKQNQDKRTLRKEFIIMPNVGMPELLIILFVVMLLFGAKKLPELARGFGQGIREFKKAAHEVEKAALPEKSE